MLPLNIDDENDEDGESSEEEEDGEDDDGGSSVQSEAEASVDPSLSWGQRKGFIMIQTTVPNPEAVRVSKK